MQTLLALVVGVLFAGGTYLVLRRDLLRLVFGVVLLSNAANLLILTAGRAARASPPLIPATGAAVEPVANPLPQALILTAIVIGFAVVTFTLVLVQRVYEVLGTVDPDRLQEDPSREAGPAGHAAEDAHEEAA